jgi:hypothetical protein
MLLLFSCCSSARETARRMSLFNVRGQAAHVAAIPPKEKTIACCGVCALQRFLWLVDANYVRADYRIFRTTPAP